MIFISTSYPIIMNNTKIRAYSDMRHAFAWLTVVWIGYVALTLLAPAAEAVSRYGLTLAQTNLLRLTIVVPYFLIWSAALFGVVWFRRYSRLIKDAPEHKGFLTITLGLFMLLLVVVVPSVIATIFTYFPHSHTAQIFNIILRNYLTIVLYGTGFWYLYQASRSLIHSIGGVEWAGVYRPVVLAALAILTFIYVWLVFQNPFRSISTDPLIQPTYALPDWLIVLTVIVPYVLIWFFGGLAILNFWSYAKTVTGIIYRKSFLSLATGLTATISLLIGLQFLSQATQSLNHATIKIVLIIIYLILLAIAIGYLLIARGARKLVEIEEVK